MCEVAPKIIDLIDKTQTEHEGFGGLYNPYSILLGYYGMSLGGLGRFAEGERLLEKGLSFARDVNNLISIAMIEMFYGVFCFYRCEPESQVKHWRTSIDYLEKSQRHIFLGQVWAWLGVSYLWTGQTHNALQCAKKGLKTHTELGLTLFRGSIHSCLSGIYLALGNFKEALAHAEQALDLSRKNNERYHEADSMLALGRATAAANRMKFDEARELMLQGINLFEELQIRPRYAVGLFYLGELYANAGQKEAAIENLKKAEGLFRDMGIDYWLDKTAKVLATL